jgi:hypothetical protein
MIPGEGSERCRWKAHGCGYERFVAPHGKDAAQQEL